MSAKKTIQEALGHGEKMYVIWVKIDETLPWIELKGKYTTKRDARKAARETLSHAVVKLVDMPTKRRASSR